MSVSTQSKNHLNSSISISGVAGYLEKTLVSFAMQKKGSPYFEGFPGIEKDWTSVKGHLRSSCMWRNLMSSWPIVVCFTQFFLKKQRILHVNSLYFFQSLGAFLHSSGVILKTDACKFRVCMQITWATQYLGLTLQKLYALLHFKGSCWRLRLLHISSQHNGISFWLLRHKKI